MTSYRLVYGYQHSGGHIRDPTALYTACPTNDYSAFQLSTNIIRTVISLLYRMSKKSLCICWTSDIDYSCHSTYSICCKYPPRTCENHISYVWDLPLPAPCNTLLASCTWTSGTLCVLYVIHCT